MVGTIIGALIAGIVIGALARLVLPGHQNISMIETILIGAISSLIGSFIYYKATGVSDTKGIDWISLLIGVVVAAILITIYSAVRGRSTGTRV